MPLQPYHAISQLPWWVPDTCLNWQPEQLAHPEGFTALGDSGARVSLPEPSFTPPFCNRNNHMLHTVPPDMTPFIGHQR